MKLLLLILQLHFNAHVRAYNRLDLVHDDTVQVYYHIKEKEFYIATGYFTLTGEIEGKQGIYRIFLNQTDNWVLFLPNRKKLILTRGKRLVIIEGV